MPPREVLFEFIRLGNSVKVNALDTLTLAEVSTVCPAGASRKDMEALALRRLESYLTRQADQAHAKGYEGMPCTACGKYTLKRTATRVKCDTCGREERFV